MTPTRLSDVQRQCLTVLYRWAKDVMRQADPADRTEWENMSDCVYSHIAEKEDTAESHMLQIAITCQIVECMLAHMPNGPEVMSMISGPMAALVVRGYIEMRKERLAEEEVIWPSNLPC